MENKFNRNERRHTYEQNIQDDLSLDEVLRMLSPNDSIEEGEKILIEIGARLALSRHEYPIFAENIEEASEFVLDEARELQYTGKYESIEEIKNEAKDCIVTGLRVFLGEYESQ